MKLHAMLDLETLGRGDDAVVTTIGYAIFGASGIRDAHEIVLSTPVQMSWGCTHEESTLTWWRSQDAAARRLMAPSLTLGFDGHKAALSGLLTSLQLADHPLVWGNGPTFDLVKLRHQFRIAGITDAPWDFWDERCFRTARALAPQVERVRPVIAHSAKADAVAQAETLIAIHETLAACSPIRLLD